jgi:Copper transport outer membrane protein, MctB
MINFRFHIVSLTAVLLALGIGLVLGTTFLDDATINGLERQLDGLEHDLDRAQARNDDQQRQLGGFEDEASLLDEQLGERLYADELAGDPVLVVSTQGVDQQWVDGVLASLTQANAELVGVWWLTERLALDDESEVGDLAAALQLSTDDSDRLGRNVAVQLADVLYGAADVASDGVPPVDPPQTAPAEPALLARLRAAGFVEYQLLDGADGDVVRLPASDLRIVVVDGPNASVAPDDILIPVLGDLTADGPMPVVATQPTPATGDEVDEASQPQLVSAVRDDDGLSQRLSTVDNLDRVSGRVATLLATVDAVPGDPTIGRYGDGDGADRLLPPAAGGG